MRTQKLTILLLVALSCISLAQSETTSADKTADSLLAQSLGEALEQYKKASVNHDHIAMASFMLPSIVEQIGGTAQVIEMLQSLYPQLEQQGFRLKEVSFGPLGTIVRHGGQLLSVIPTSTPVNLDGKSGSLRSSVVALSSEEGKTWFFVEGSDEGRMHISDVAPGVLQNISVPTPSLILGSGSNEVTLIQQNGEWVRK